MQLIGTRAISVEVVQVAALQNISGENWPEPPPGGSHVTYCYVAPADAAAIVQLAAQHSATFREEPVRVDGDRRARLVYHEDGQLPSSDDQMRINVEIWLQTDAEGARWLHLVYAPPAGEAAEGKEEHEKEEEEVAPLLSQVTELVDALAKTLVVPFSDAALNALAAKIEEVSESDPDDRKNAIALSLLQLIQSELTKR